ncbi:inositol monophosphatase family protein [Paenibacillus lemnae]|uniref:inositol monophosphatase family protein n=1 Tax=Paenibacillus lemnae TaxID=1330551 RepID=UPI001FE56105|nr:inositol monophosphatase family protein [Paenibacillus lemnae]
MEAKTAVIIEAARVTAVRAANRAGEMIRSYFDRNAVIEEKGLFGDVVTEVDRKAEEVILEEIMSKFPDHGIHSEESGSNGRTSDWLWLVDPLDGTNNFVIGFPAFSVSVTLMYRREPVLGVIYEPMVDRLYVTSKDGGTSCNGNPVRIRKGDRIERGTIGWIQGHAVQNDEHAVRLRHHLDFTFKRMMRLWAPTLVWCMLAKGDIDGIVLYNSEGDDLYSGILMVQEAGGLVMDFEGRPFSGMTPEPYLIACHPEHREYFLKVVKEGRDTIEHMQS